MRIKHPVLQILVLVVLASVIAVVANGFASRQRRLMLPGYYPGATTVPSSTPVPPPPRATSLSTGASVPPASGTTAPATTTVESPGPGQPPIAITTAPPVTTTVAPIKKPVEAIATPAPPVTPPAPAADPLARFAAHPDKPYVEVSGDDAALLHSKGALVLDARRTSVYEEGHIAGARSFSVWEADIDEKVNGLFNERSDPREQNLPIVIYCSGGACEDSHMLAQKLWGIQFNNVYVYKDGFPDWQKRGGPVRNGANP